MLYFKIVRFLDTQYYDSYLLIKLMRLFRSLSMLFLVHMTSVTLLIFITQQSSKNRYTFTFSQFMSFLCNIVMLVAHVRSLSLNYNFNV